MKGRLSPEIEVQLSLYLDDQLPASERLEFERRIGTDPDLREALEFHRGLTLEFHEEAPPLPRGYADRARARFEGAAPLPVARPWWRGPIGLSLAASAAVVVVVMAIVGPGASRRSGSPARVASNPDSAARDLDATRMKEQEKADQETIEALRSLGYLSSGRPAAPPGKTQTIESRKTKLAKVLAPATESAGRKDPVALEDRPAASLAASQAAGPTASPAAGPAAAGAAAGAAPAPVPFRVVPLPTGPDLGRDHLVIRSAEAWVAFVGAADRPAPVAAFEAEMLVVLRDDLARDPPARLRVLAITRSTAEIVVICRIETRGAGGKEGGGDDAGAGSATGAAGPGQAIILPAADLPVRVVVNQDPDPGR